MGDLIDKAEALEILELAEHDAEERDWRSGANEIARIRKRIAAIPARGVGEYTLAPHLQKIVDGAKTAPQWDTQADRLAPTDAAQAREAALREAADVLVSAIADHKAKAPVTMRGTYPILTENHVATILALIEIDVMIGVSK